MVKALEDAIEKIKRLPEDRQTYAAEILEQIASLGGGVFVVPDDHRAAVMEGLAEADRGEFASDAEVEALLRKPWR